MFSEKDILTARKIAQSIKVPHEFGREEYDGYFDLEPFYEQVEDLTKDYGDCYLHYGISKLVFIFDNLPFVIKVPFNGYWYSYEDPDTRQEERYFEPFECECNDSYGDYCAIETEVIQDAQHFGFGAIMADEMCIGDYNFHPFYIQEKVKSARVEIPRTPSEDSLKKAKELDNLYQICADVWRALAIESYGEIFWKRFIEWADTHATGILEDMHSGNYGYRYDGTPVMFDVSGFNED